MSNIRTAMNRGAYDFLVKPVDFIDLEDDKNRKKIYDELKKEFKRDRAKIAMLPMTEFGLMQITRERIRENIVQSMTESCPYCNGSGLLTKKSNLIYEIEEWLKRYKAEGKNRMLILRRWQWKYFLRLKLVEDENMSLQSFKITSHKTDEDLTEEFS